MLACKNNYTKIIEMLANYAPQGINTTNFVRQFNHVIFISLGKWDHPSRCLSFQKCNTWNSSYFDESWSGSNFINKGLMGYSPSCQIYPLEKGNCITASYFTGIMELCWSHDGVSFWGEMMILNKHIIASFCKIPQRCSLSLQSKNKMHQQLVRALLDFYLLSI